MIIESQKYLVTYGDKSTQVMLGSFLKRLLNSNADIASWRKVPDNENL